MVINTASSVTHRTSASALARELLDLTDDQETRLFRADNTVDDLQRIVKDIANGDL